ncbi:hypothetical protein B0I26_10865 [Anoxybacillus vitaminiphilus]|uniref:ATLF-like domain-containing protein n=2 Tax=Paranoxybacillus vitaminiphilus TaxID=581036 RepID=A0A327YCR9_9BACL|nr:toxin [Anoxybacillus vitaminiphilus]RAK18890.1 hypothetical protein B0I26_10865 [Anoxybacillus vitaminiphilus]
MRYINLLLCILLIIPLTSFSHPFPSQGILLEDSELRSFFPSDAPIQKIIVLPEQKFQQTEALKIIQTIEQVHPSILRKIAAKRIYVKLFTGKITDERTASHLHGEQPRGYLLADVTWNDVPGMGGTHVVLVKIGHSERGKGHGSINLELHELAHSVDRIVFNGIRFQPRFLTIWRKEAYQLFPGNSYFLNYPEEYFAESFAMYYYSEKTRQQLKKTAPLTYQYIKNLEK